MNKKTVALLFTILLPIIVLILIFVFINYRQTNTDNLKPINVNQNNQINQVEEGFQTPPPVEPSDNKDNQVLPPTNNTSHQDSDQFNEDLENLSIDTTRIYSITGDKTVDEKIIQLALKRGYQSRPLPTDEDLLVRINNTHHYLQPKAALAFLKLKDEALTVGYDIQLVSAYRSPDYQRQVFLRHLKQPYNEANILQRLKWSAPPGFSKHQTGYAIDITQSGTYFEDFGQTKAYSWLAANDFAKAKEYGWWPSYPADVLNQGPEPEPWEFIYVGL